MLTTLFWTVSFCLGWRIITDEGQLLNFIKKPFEYSLKQIEHLENLIELRSKFEKTLVSKLKSELLRHKLIVQIGKPIVLCITCFASVWGVSVFIALNGLDESLAIPLILNSVASAFIQTFIWKIYDRISI